MPVEIFRYTDEKFEAVQWTGHNLAEVSGFAGQDLQAVGSLLAVRLDPGEPVPGGPEPEIAVVQVGWWVRRAADGGLCVGSGRVQRLDWVPAGAGAARPV